MENFDGIGQASLVDFYNLLDEAEEVFSVYETFNLIDELNTLEKQFHKLGSYSLQFYQSVSNRIYKYSANATDDSTRKVLSYLYTATLSKINYLNLNWVSNLIIDMEKYLGSVKQDISALKDMEKQQSKNEIITQ